jgi:DNA-binding NarL/FixJ family response regulator
MSLNIVIADDHPLFRQALRLAVTHALSDVLVSEADSAAALFAVLNADSNVDLVLLDLGLPDAQGFSALVQTRATYPKVPVLVVSGRDEPELIARTVAHGAAGFVPKSASGAMMLEALQTVLSGRVWMPLAQARSSLDPTESEAATLVARLTRQQFRVLVMLCSGMQNKQIGARLNVTEATVKAHMRAIMEKFGANNRTQVVLMTQHLALDQPAASAERKYRIRSRVPARNAG